MIDKKELRRLAEAFPADLDWDSNTEPFFNGPSGESLGGGADGTYAVYGKPFRLEGEDYDYDGPTYVERCGKDFARFIVEARGAVLVLLDEIESRKDPAFTVLASLHTHSDGRKRIQIPGMAYDQDAGWGAHVEQLVSLSEAKSAVFQAVIRCEQKGAFKICLECGYQDGHDEICQYHESKRGQQ